MQPSDCSSLGAVLAALHLRATPPAAPHLPCAGGHSVCHGAGGQRAQGRTRQACWRGGASRTGAGCPGASKDRQPGHPYLGAGDGRGGWAGTTRAAAASATAQRRQPWGSLAALRGGRDPGLRISSWGGIARAWAATHSSLPCNWPARRLRRPLRYCYKGFRAPIKLSAHKSVNCDGWAERARIRQGVTVEQGETSNSRATAKRGY